MTELRRLWTEALPPYPERELRELERAVSPTLYPVCACFRLFRYLHQSETADALLMGDACFARFSHHLAALDDVELTDRFSDYLRADSLCGQPFSAYLDFARSLRCGP